jgi:hypothetical protein
MGPVVDRDFRPSILPHGACRGPAESAACTVGTATETGARRACAGMAANDPSSELSESSSRAPKRATSSRWPTRLLEPPRLNSMAAASRLGVDSEVGALAASFTEIAWDLRSPGAASEDGRVDTSRRVLTWAAEGPGQPRHVTSRATKCFEWAVSLGASCHPDRLQAGCLRDPVCDPTRGCEGKLRRCQPGRLRLSQPRVARQPRPHAARMTLCLGTTPLQEGGR